MNWCSRKWTKLTGKQAIEYDKSSVIRCSKCCNYMAHLYFVLDDDDCGDWFCPYNKCTGDLVYFCIGCETMNT